MRAARLLIVGVFILFNCKDPINIHSDGAIGILVLDGKVTTQPGPYELRLGYTVGVAQKPRAVSYALVTLYDDAGNSENYVEIKPGVYSVPGNVITGTAGRAYHVEVTLENGKTYSSKPEVLPLATGIDTPTYDFGTRSEFIGEVEAKINVINVYVDTQLPTPGERDYFFRWDVIGTFMFEQSPRTSPLTGTLPPPCYVTEFTDPQRITLFSTRNQVIEAKKHTLIATRDINYAFLTRHWFTININSITRESYEYWKNVNQLINRSGSIFDTPPAPIEGNVFSKTDKNETVFGYFEAANTNFKRFYVLRGDIPISLLPYCNDPKYGPYWGGYPDACQNCLLLNNSTTDMPSWFADVQ